MNDLIRSWEIEASYLDSARTYTEHWSTRRYTVFAGTLEAACELVHAQEAQHKHEIHSVKPLYLGSGVLGLGDGIEAVARSMHPDGLLKSRHCRTDEHASCYGRAYGLLPDGNWDRPCECPCHAPVDDDAPISLDD